VKYNPLTQDYFRCAAAAGVLSGPGVFRGAAGDRQQGTWVQFDVRPVLGALEAVSFLAFGCPHTIAVSAWLAEHAIGGALVRELPYSLQDLRDRFAIPVDKMGRLLIVEDAWRAALSAAIESAV
jgi:NifU-like protein involved in Fe-S cluster formation